MSTRSHPKRPLSRRIQARVMRAANVPMRRVLALPLATPLSERLMLVHLTGRRTGRHYIQPVSYVRDGETLLTPGGGAWKQNLVEGRPERLRLRGRDVFARPEIIRDAGEVRALLGIMIDANPTVGRFVGVSKRPDGSLDVTRIENAIRYGFRVIRWHPCQSGATDRAA